MVLSRFYHYHISFADEGTICSEWLLNDEGGKEKKTLPFPLAYIYVDLGSHEKVSEDVTASPSLINTYVIYIYIGTAN